jgi:GAF domain-containing protein
MTNYKELITIIPALIEEDLHDISILSNISAILNEYMNNINWVGFYLNKNNKLLLGPFQGKVACTTIPFNRGVCGACATSNTTIIVPNVHEFPGHIACDSASLSEICVPINVKGEFYGLLDIDAPITNRFTNDDKFYLEKIVSIIENKLNRL